MATHIAELRLRPISLKEARRFVAEHHRHSEPTKGWKFGVGLEDSGAGLVGVGVAGRPIAKALDDGVTLEILRCCTDGSRNAASMLYGSLSRAAKALGYVKVITYTLQSEDGASLKASGFQVEAEVESDTWNRPKRSRQDETLFGPRRLQVPRLRWSRHL